MNTPVECRSCGSEIVFIKTFKGKNMPVDLPEDGPERDRIMDADLYERDTMTSHFDTCDQADKHRINKTSTTTVTHSDAGGASINAKRLNTAIAALEDIAVNDVDPDRSITIARVALSQIKAMK